MSFDSPQKSPLMSNVSCVHVFLDCGVLLTVCGVSDNDGIGRFLGKQLGIPRGCSAQQQDIGE